MQSVKPRLYFTVILMLLMLSASAIAQKKNKDKEQEKGNAANLPEVIWRAPGDVASLNLLYGAGGKEHAPERRRPVEHHRERRVWAAPAIDRAVPEFHVERTPLRLTE